MKILGFCFCAILVSFSSVQATKKFTKLDKDLIDVALNLEYFEAEFFLFGAYGYGLDKVAPHLTGGGPPPIGGQKANLDSQVKDIFIQMGLQEVGHIRAIKNAIGNAAFPRVQLDISKSNWAKLFNKAFNKSLEPPFDPYYSSLNYVIASYVIPYVGLTGYAGASADLEGKGAKSLVARLLAVEAGQDAVIRTWLYERKSWQVEPYGYTVAEFTDAISTLRDQLDGDGVTDEGLVVPKALGAEGLVTGNILSADVDSTAYTRTPEQIFEVVYSTGNASKPGGFYPAGGNGTYAKKYLGEKYVY